jgi:hypothetical protein
MSNSATMYTKTKMCTFFMKGQCTKGSACTYAHSCSDQRGKPDLSRTQMCSAFLAGACKNGKRCGYAHHQSELRVLGKPSRQHRLKQERSKDYRPVVVSEFYERGDASPLGHSSFAEMPLCEPQCLNRGDIQVVALAPHFVVYSMCAGVYGVPLMQARESVETDVSAELRADYEMQYTASKGSDVETDAGVESQSDYELQSMESKGSDKTTSNAESLPTLLGRRERCVAGEGVLCVKNTFLEFLPADAACMRMRRTKSESDSPRKNQVVVL